MQEEEMSNKLRATQQMSDSVAPRRNKITGADFKKLKKKKRKA